MRKDVSFKIHDGLVIHEEKSPHKSLSVPINRGHNQSTHFLLIDN